MRILFVNGYAFLPQVVGGIEVSTLDLCLALNKIGHDTAVLCSVVSGDRLWLWNRIKSKLTGQQFPSDKKCGLNVYRGWSTINGLQEVAEREQPDAIVVQGGLYNSYEIAAKSAQLGYRTFYYTHDLGVILSGKPLPPMQGVTWIANSAFTARTLNTRLGVECEIIPPLFRADSYKTQVVGKAITMINPRPEKGGEIAVTAAELCPDIPFQFVEAWSNQHPDVLKLKARAIRLPNVTWLPVQNNMRAIYGATRILLMPSQCEETWGRVITEAQFLGIPAIVSQIGALPETMGNGGVAIDAAADAETWVKEIRRLYGDQDMYRRYSDAAKTHALRDDLNPDKVAAKFANLTAHIS